MTLKELIEELQKFPPELDLKDCRASIALGRERSSIMYVYLCGYRIYGMRPIPNWHEVVRQTNLSDISRSLISGLRSSVELTT